MECLLIPFVKVSLFRSLSHSYTYPVLQSCRPSGTVIKLKTPIGRNFVFLTMFPAAPEERNLYMIFANKQTLSSRRRYLESTCKCRSWEALAHCIGILSLQSYRPSGTVIIEEMARIEIVHS